MNSRILLIRLPGSNIPYDAAFTLQQELSDQRRRDAIPDTLLLLEHPPVYTMGRSARPEHLLWDRQALEEAGVEVFPTDRGGDITYHGPGQLIGYPIVRLAGGNRDVLRYVQKLEECLIQTAADFQITAVRDSRNRGIWVGDDKLAALGIRVAGGVTTHGFALNVNTDLSMFKGIVPCGIQNVGVTSLARIAGRQIRMSLIRRCVIKHFSAVFGYEKILEEPCAMDAGENGSLCAIREKEQAKYLSGRVDNRDRVG